MDKKSFDFSAFAIAIIIIAILFSACTNGKDSGNDNGNEKPNNITNEAVVYDEDTTVVRFSLWDCFIAHDPKEDTEMVVYQESYGCTPGYLYFEREVYGEVKLLLPIKCKLLCGVFETENKAYVVTEENEVIKVNKRDGAYETVYKAQYGSIDINIHDFDDLNHLYFNDGDYIVRLNTNTEEYDIPVHSEKGVYWVSAAGSVHDDGDHFYCNVCGENDDYFIWQDNEENIYWYHPEKGESEQVEDRELYWGHPATLFSNEVVADENSANDSNAVNPEKVGFGYRDSFVAPDPVGEPSVAEYYDSYNCSYRYLYLRKDVYGEIKLLVPKAIKGDERVETKSAVYTIVLDDDTYMDGREVVKADKQNLTYKVVYTDRIFDIHRIVKSADGNYIYFGDGYELIRLDLSTDKWEVLTKSPNEDPVISIRGYLNDGSGPFYCVTCGDEGEHVFWEDFHNVYWYHPKTGENEKIDWETFYETHQAN